MRFHHIDRSIELINQIETEGRKLQRRHPRILGVSVVIEKPHQQHNTGNQVTARVSVSLPGKLVVSSKQSDGPQESDNASIALTGAFRAAERSVNDYLHKRWGKKPEHKPKQILKRFHKGEVSARNKLLCYLAGAAMSMATVSTDAAQSQLSEVPEQVIAELLGDLDESMQEQDIIRLIDLLAEDTRTRVKRDVLEFLVNLKGKHLRDHSEQLFLRWARDRDREIRRVVAESLVRWFAEMDSLTRSRVIAEWALSEHPMVRRTIAEALSLDFQALGIDVVMEYLSDDQSAEIRAVVAKAATRRFEENPGSYSALLGRLASDRDRRVRKAARQACREKALFQEVQT